MNIDPCENCGLCCEHLIVEAGPLDLLREPRIETARPLGKLDVSLSILHACWLLAGPGMPCTFLTPKKRCGIYPTRPTTCVGFVAGSSKCQELRKEHGLPPAPVQSAIHAILQEIIGEIIAEEGHEPD